jgi:hypothetical protein
MAEPVLLPDRKVAERYSVCVKSPSQDFIKGYRAFAT